MKQIAAEISDRCLALIDRATATLDYSFTPDSPEARAFIAVIKKTFASDPPTADTSPIRALKDPASRNVVIDALLQTLEAVQGELRGGTKNEISQ